MRADPLARSIPAAFERAPALTERLERHGPYRSPEGLLERARRLVDEMTEGEKIAVLNAHPRIGADPAILSDASRREQGGAEDPAVLRELSALNEAYERRFGFRFVVFVDSRAQSRLLPVLRQRLRRSRDAELATGISEFLAIARDRLSRRP